jgi:hypothetical protein
MKPLRPLLAAAVAALVLAGCSAGASQTPSSAPSVVPSAAPSQGAVTTPEQAAALVLATDPRFAGVGPFDPDMIGQSAWYTVDPASEADRRRDDGWATARGLHREARLTHWSRRAAR